MTDNKELGCILPSRTALPRQHAGLKLVNSLLRLGFRVIWLSEPFTCLTEPFPKGHTYEAGDFLILSNSDSSEVRSRDHSFVKEMAVRRGALVHALLEDCDPVGYLLTVPKIAVYRGAGTWDCYLWYTECLRSMGFSHDALSPSEIAAGRLRKYDVHIQPGGDETWQSAALWPKGRDEIRSFLEDGGNYIGSCGGLDIAGEANGSTLCSPNSGEIKFLNLVSYECPRNVLREEYPHDEWARNYWYHIDFDQYSQLVPIALGTPVPLHVRRISPLVFGYEDTIIPGPRYSAGPIAKKLRDPMRVIAEFAPELLPLDSPWSIPPDKATELFKSAAAISESTLGKGKLVFFAPHPEDPNNPEYFKMVANAIFYLTAKGPAKADSFGDVPVQRTPHSTKAFSRTAFEEVERTLSETKNVSENLIRSYGPIKKLDSWEYRHVPEWLLKLPGYSLILMPDLEIKTLEQHIAELVTLVSELRRKVQLLGSCENSLMHDLNALVDEISANTPSRLRRAQKGINRMITELNNLQPIVHEVVELRKQIDHDKSRDLESRRIENWAELDAKQSELNNRLWREIVLFLDGKAETSIFSVWRPDVLGRDSKGILTELSEIRTQVSSAIEICDYALAIAPPRMETIAPKAN